LPDGGYPYLKGIGDKNGTIRAMEEGLYPLTHTETTMTTTSKTIDHHRSESVYYDKEEAEEFRDHLEWNDQPPKFLIRRATRELVCPDGRVLTFADTGCAWDDGTEELYAEWNDVGVFYHPVDGHKKTETWWIETCDPTYEHRGEADELVRLCGEGDEEEEDEEEA